MNNQPLTGDRPILPPMGVTVLGTDTEVGKTYQSALLLWELQRRNIQAGAYKPIASGVPQDQQSHSTSSDGGILHAALQGHWPLEMICPQQFVAPLAPPLAAKLEGSNVNQPLVIAGATAWRGQCEFLVIETAGGPLSPVSEQWTSLDLAKQFPYPTILIAANRLGCVSQTLLALEAIHNRGLPCLGVVLNEIPKPQSAHQEGAEEAGATEVDPNQSDAGQQSRSDSNPTNLTWCDNRDMIQQFGRNIRVESTIEKLCEAALRASTT